MRMQKFSILVGLTLALAAPAALAAPISHSGTLFLNILVPDLPLPEVMTTATGTADVRGPGHSLAMNASDFMIRTTLLVMSPDLVNAVIIAGGSSVPSPTPSMTPLPLPVGSAVNGPGNFTPSAPT